MGEGGEPARLYISDYCTAFFELSSLSLSYVVVAPYLFVYVSYLARAVSSVLMSELTDVPQYPFPVGGLIAVDLGVT